MSKKGNIKVKQNKKVFSVKKTCEKIDYFFTIITDTIIWAEKYKVNDIINASDLNVCIQNLENIYEELVEIKDVLKSNKKNTVQIISKHKKVFDLKGVKYISGLIKNKPILKPGSKLRLELNYSMRSKIASIIGYFSIICLNTSTKCKAYIPTIKLSPPETLN